MCSLNFCFTVDDVGYDGYSSEEHLARYLEFCGEQGLKSTLFTVPLYADKDFRQRKAYIKLLKNAVSDGHEVAQHGLRHDRFETGVPPPFIMNLPHEGPARKQLADSRASIDRNNSVGNIRQRIAQGRGILEDALGHGINGFRGGAGSSCPNLFTALEEEGYMWDSTRIIQETGWDLIQGVLDTPPQPITRERFDQLQFPGTLKELPLTTDYTWYLTQEKYSASLALAIHDLESCFDADVPFIPVTHVSPFIECEQECGFRLYRELVAHAKQSAADRGLPINFITMTQAANQLQR